MFKLVVLFAIVAVAAAKPGFLAHEVVAPVVAAVPAATSYQSQVDIHSKPIIAAYSTPVVAATYTHPAPIAYASPAAYATSYVASPLAYVSYAAPSIHPW